MDMELIPLAPFKDQLTSLCRAQIADAMTGLNAINMAEKDRGYLFPHEETDFERLENQLKLNESLLLAINSKFMRMQ